MAATDKKAEPPVLLAMTILWTHGSIETYNRNKIVRLAMIKDQRVVSLQHYFQQQSAIRQVILFGSVASNRARFESDIDVAVELDHALDAAEKSRLIEKISAITGRAVDLIDLKTVGQPLLGQIIEHGLRLVGDDVSYGMLLSKNAFDHEDFLPYRQRILDVRRQTWIGC